MRYAAGELDNLLAAGYLAERVRQDLPVLAGDAANSGLRALRSSRNANMICVRLATEVSRHAGNAAAAVSMTCFASSTLASATSAVTAPVAGFVTGAEVLASPAKILPSHQCCTVSVIGRSFQRCGHTAATSELLCRRTTFA